MKINRTKSLLLGLFAIKIQSCILNFIKKPLFCNCWNLLSFKYLYIAVINYEYTVILIYDNFMM